MWNFWFIGPSLSSEDHCRSVLERLVSNCASRSMATDSGVQMTQTLVLLIAVFLLLMWTMVRSYEVNDNNLTIVFNGEIYNYKDLRDSLSTGFLQILTQRYCSEHIKMGQGYVIAQRMFA